MADVEHREKNGVDVDGPDAVVRLLEADPVVDEQIGVLEPADRYNPGR